LKFYPLIRCLFVSFIIEIKEIFFSRFLAWFFNSKINLYIEEYFIFGRQIGIFKIDSSERKPKSLTRPQSANHWSIRGLSLFQQHNKNSNQSLSNGNYMQFKFYELLKTLKWTCNVLQEKLFTRLSIFKANKVLLKKMHEKLTCGKFWWRQSRGIAI
jgi:hypothetical protein